MDEITPIVTKNKQGRRLLNLTLALGVAAVVGAVTGSYISYFLKSSVAKSKVTVSGIVESKGLDYKVAQIQDQENTVGFYVRPESVFYLVEDNTQPSGKMMLHGCLKNQIRVEVRTGNSLPRLQNGDTVTFEVNDASVEEGKNYDNISSVSCMRPKVYNTNGVRTTGLLQGKLISYSTKITKFN